MVVYEVAWIIKLPYQSALDAQTSERTKAFRSPSSAEQFKTILEQAADVLQAELYPIDIREKEIE